MNELIVLLSKLLSHMLRHRDRGSHRPIPSVRSRRRLHIIPIPPNEIREPIIGVEIQLLH